MRHTRFLQRAAGQAVLCAALALATLITASDAYAAGKIVVANRGSANLTVIDARTNTVATTVPMPMLLGENTPEPMYVVHVPARRQVFVGDRANDRVVAFDAQSFQVLDLIPAGAGVFHMWADDRNGELWVNNDIDNTATVIDVQTHAVVATVPIPDDLTDDGGKPHDIFVHPQGYAAYMSIVGLPGPDIIVKFDTSTFTEVARAEVGEDPHLSLSKQEGLLFVPCQNTNEVVVLDEDHLTELDSIPVPGAHGAAMTNNGNVFYTTNLPGGGVDGLFAIDTDTGNILSVTDTKFPVPHNIALTPNGNIYVTHSGATATKVTVYSTQGNSSPTYIAAVDAGMNPFGLAYVP